MIAYLRTTLTALIVPLVLLGLWFWLHQVKGANNSFVTNPFEVWARATAIRAELTENGLLSLRRVILGVAGGSLLGAIAGISLGRWNLGRMLFAPTLNVLTAIPFLVFIPFFLIVFGFGELCRVSVIAATTFLLVYQQAFTAVRELSPDYIELALVYEKTQWQIAREVLVPAALPAIVNAVRFSFYFAWLAVALAEKAVAEWPNGGLGYLVLRAREQGLYNDLFAGVIVIALLAWMLDRIVARLHRRLSQWQDVSH